MTKRSKQHGYNFWLWVFVVLFLGFYAWGLHRYYTGQLWDQLAAFGMQGAGIVILIFYVHDTTKMARSNEELAKEARFARMGGITEKWVSEVVSDVNLIDGGMTISESIAGEMTHMLDLNDKRVLICRMTNHGERPVIPKQIKFVVSYKGGNVEHRLTHQFVAEDEIPAGGNTNLQVILNPRGLIRARVDEFTYVDVGSGDEEETFTARPYQEDLRQVPQTDNPE